MVNRKLGEIIRRNPVTLPPSASVAEACRLMRDHRIGAIMVTEDDGRLIGLFTGRDVVNRVAAECRDAANTSLESVMTNQPDTLKPAQRAIDALRMMQDGGYRHLPILHDDVIIGIVSLGDFSGLEKARLDDETGFWEVM